MESSTLLDFHADTNSVINSNFSSFYQNKLQVTSSQHFQVLHIIIQTDIEST